MLNSQIVKVNDEIPLDKLLTQEKITVDPKLFQGKH
jgi:hypothetical protein